MLYQHLLVLVAFRDYDLPSSSAADTDPLTMLNTDCRIRESVAGLIMWSAVRMSINADYEND